MKTLVFGDLAHVRSFGANLTTHCLKQDLENTMEGGEKLLFEPMPHIGKHYSRKWYALQKLNPQVVKTIRDTRMRLRSVDLEKIVYKNVHYNSPLSDILPNTLDQFCDIQKYINNSSILKNIYKRVKWCDRLIINGEGNIVNHIGDISTPYRIGARFLFASAFMAKKLGKPFSLVNCTIDPNNSIVDEVLSDILKFASHVSLREPVSHEYATSKLKLDNAVEGADASVGYCFNDYNNKYDKFIVIGDSSGLRGGAKEIYENMKTLIVNAQRRGYHVKLLDCSTPYSHVIGMLARELRCSWLSDHYLNFRTLQSEIQGARLMMSGRWHPSILAANVGVPCVTYGSDSCKTLGFSMKLGSLHIRGGLADLTAHEDEVYDFGRNADRVEVLRRSSEWAAQRLMNIVRPS